MLFRSMRMSRAGSSGRSSFPRMSNRVRLAEVERGMGLQVGWGSWVEGVTPLHIGLRDSMLSGVRVLGGVGVQEGSRVVCREGIDGGARLI